MKKKINPYVLGYVAIYVSNLIFASREQGFPLEEALGITLIVGIGFSLIAYAVSFKATPLIEEKASFHGEGLALLALVLLLTGSIVAGNRPFESMLPASLSNEDAERSVISMVRKLLTFVIIPFLVYRRFQFRPTDFGLSPDWRKAFAPRSIMIFVVMSAVVLGLNYFGGRAAQPVRDGVFTSGQLLAAIPLLFLWNYVEVGLVEEFFFRGLLQNRLAVILKSPWGAIFISALIFGLVHAPGMYLRGAGAVEGLGTEPTLLFCISYCIAVQSVTGIFFGIIWYKTRNLWLLMGIHAMTDLLPHLAKFIATWSI